MLIIQSKKALNRQSYLSFCSWTSSSYSLLMHCTTYFFLSSTLWLYPSMASTVCATSIIRSFTKYLFSTSRFLSELQLLKRVSNLVKIPWDQMVSNTSKDYSRPFGWFKYRLYRNICISVLSTFFISFIIYYSSGLS